jgi:hypothetical protein
MSASTTAHVREIEGTVDLFDDGSVTTIEAPGHTPGHQVVLLKPTEIVGTAGASIWLSHEPKDFAPTFNPNGPQIHRDERMQSHGVWRSEMVKRHEMFPAGVWNTPHLELLAEVVELGSQQIRQNCPRC